VQSTGIEKLVQTHIVSAQQGNDADDLKEESDDRQETWYELFYDLVFVAAALQLGLIIKYDHRLMGVVKAGVLFLILRSTWDHLVLYQNRCVIIIGVGSVIEDMHILEVISFSLQVSHG
jgi:low temperature requirement protein LtrA